MGRKNKQGTIEFIESSSDWKLVGFPSPEKQIDNCDDFRLDIQGVTTTEPKQYNIHLQVNNPCKIPSLKLLLGRTVTSILVPVDIDKTPEEIRNIMIEKVKGSNL
ncbi:hypothetical protein CC80DRAFT_399938 [Byssothecium circinans]|uniref:Uncharacterized protein n=1 Tax=Byssothecium circinans TaxID=147558 RepID=A0A6A5UN98_9PLEO|nr:hypothetical protein CC80DRAFT_399938 [Byssothecium circinans]